MSDPPMITIRRTSRLTYAYSSLARTAIDPDRGRASLSTARRPRFCAPAAACGAGGLLGGDDLRLELGRASLL